MSNINTPMHQRSVLISDKNKYISSTIDKVKEAFLTLPVVIQAALEQSKRVIWEFPKNCVTAYNPLTGE